MSVGVPACDQLGLIAGTQRTDIQYGGRESRVPTRGKGRFGRVNWFGRYGKYLGIWGAS